MRQSINHLRHNLHGRHQALRISADRRLCADVLRVGRRTAAGRQRAVRPAALRLVSYFIGRQRNRRFQRPRGRGGPHHRRQSPLRYRHRLRRRKSSPVRRCENDRLVASAGPDALRNRRRIRRSVHPGPGGPIAKRAVHDSLGARGGLCGDVSGHRPHPDAVRDRRGKCNRRSCAVSPRWT